MIGSPYEVTCTAGAVSKGKWFLVWQTQQRPLLSPKCILGVSLGPAQIPIPVGASWGSLTPQSDRVCPEPAQSCVLGLLLCAHLPSWP